MENGQKKRKKIPTNGDGKSTMYRNRTIEEIVKPLYEKRDPDGGYKMVNGKLKKGELSYREVRFAEEYLVDGDAPRAAMRSGFSKYPFFSANKLVEKPAVKEEIIRQRRFLESRTQVTQAVVLEGLAEMLLYNPKNFFDGEGNPLPIQDISSIDAKAIVRYESDTVEIEPTDTQPAKKITKVRLTLSDNRKAALDSIGRILGMFEKDNQQRRPIGITIAALLDGLPEELAEGVRERIAERVIDVSPTTTSISNLE